MTLEQTPIEQPTKKFDALEFLLAGVTTYEELQTRIEEIRAQSPEVAAWVIKTGLEGHHEDNL